VEGLDLANGDDPVVNLCFVAEDLCEGVLLFFIGEEEQLVFVVGDFPVRVDPLEVDILVLLGVRMLDEESPHCFNVLDTKEHLVD
jgi:hypothetical protein